MTQKERELALHFKHLVETRLHVREMYVFGSRARGGATAESDLDVLVVTDEPETQENLFFVYDCAYDTAFSDGFTLMISPTLFSRDRWENSPDRSSPLAQSVRREGIPV